MQLKYRKSFKRGNVWYNAKLESYEFIYKNGLHALIYTVKLGTFEYLTEGIVNYDFLSIENEEEKAKAIYEYLTKRINKYLNEQ